MKKTALTVLLLLTALFLLASCGKTKTVPSFTADKPQGSDADGITLRTQFPSYAPDCESVNVILTNNSGDRVEYGSSWLLEREEKGEWRMVPFVEDFGFTDELNFLDDGDDWANTCLLKFFTSAVTEGHYRIAMEVNGAYYYAEFDFAKDAPITAEAPFGHAPLEKLPKNYKADQAAADGAVILNMDGTVSNAEAVLEFFEAVKIRHLSAELRTGAVTVEGQLILHDLLWDGEKLCLRTDDSRDSFAAAGGITTEYYSTFAEDGTNVYPSNSADLPQKRLSIPGFTAVGSYTPDPRIPEIVRDLSGRELKVYSADGICSAGASLDDPLSYWLASAAKGQMLSVSAERTKDYPDAKIVDFAWEGNTLMVMVQLDESWYYYEFVDSDTFEVISYTGSQYPYKIEDGKILILE